MARVHVLPDLVANQIAAGEVVERPASVLKELLENSFDAGAGDVAVDVEDGGVGLIRVRDDGAGIERDDLPLVLQRHATSKLRTSADLVAIASYGFRGEAMAAIASVSRLLVRSRRRGEETGWEVRVAGGTGSDLTPAPSPHPEGTTVEMRDLFFNTPARKKFLRSPRTELERLSEVWKHAALANFSASLAFSANNAGVRHLPAALGEKGRNQRVGELVGQNFLSQSLFFEHARSGLKLWGWLGLPTFNRSTRDGQYFFVNGRAVRDKTVQHAVRAAYADVLFKERFPAFVLYLELDPSEVDVNVHPTKHEVRFREARLVHDFLVKTLQQVIGAHRPGGFGSAPPIAGEQVVMGDEGVAAVTGGEERGATASAAQNSASSFVGGGSARSFDSGSRPAAKSSSFLARGGYGRSSFSPSHGVEVRESAPNDAWTLPKLFQEQDLQQQGPLGTAIAQVHGRFILAENAEGLVLVDQHAAHERLLLEDMKASSAETCAAQELLVPEVVALSVAQMELWERYAEVFAGLGIHGEMVGPENLAVRALPSYLRGVPIPDLLRETLEDLAQYGSTTELVRLREEAMGNLACRAAIKVNHSLALPEMNALLRRLEKTPRAGQCNHGRPTYVKLDLDELDKLFLRGR